MSSKFNHRIGGLFKSFTLLIWLLSSFALAQDNRDLQVHGFVSQGLIEAGNSDFVNDNGDFSTALTEVGINTSYQLTDNIRFAGQVVYLDGGNRYAKGGRVDYALLDWSAFQTQSSKLNVYLGRYKNYHWLYSSTRDVPFARPSIVLPQSVYFDGFRDIAVGGDGIAVSFKHNNSKLGDVDINFSFGTSNISNKQRTIILGEFAKGKMKHDMDYQGSVYWQPTDSQWRFGLAVLDSEFSYQAQTQDAFLDANIILQRYIVNGLYEAEQWEFSGEAFQERFVLDGFYSPIFHQDNIGQGFFVQTRYQLSNKVRLLTRYEKFFANKDDKQGKTLEQITQGQISAHFGFQHDITIGISLDLLPNTRLLFEHHWLEGTARLTPVVAPNTQLNIHKRWQILAAQLMYWF